MFLPTGDTPNPRNFTPWVNGLLIAANVAVFALVSWPLSGRAPDPDDPRLTEYLRAVLPHLPRGVSPEELLATLSAYDLFVFEHGFKPGAPELADLFASMFLHGGFLHLAGNMLFLWIYGDNCEHRLGRVPYLMAYLLTGVAATLAFSLFAGGSMTPMVGASGAISGVLGLYYVLFPRNGVKVFVFLPPFLFNTFLLPARWVLGFYLVMDNLFPVLLGAESGVAYGAHIGGFVAGLAVAFVGERVAWSLPWAGRVARRTSVESATGRGSPGAGPEGGGDVVPARDDSTVEALRAAVAAGNAGAALAAAAALAERDLDALSPRECVALAAWMDDAGHDNAAARLLRRCLVRRITPRERADLFLQLGLLRLGQGQAASAYQHLLDALDSDPSPETEAAAREALGRIEVWRGQSRQGPGEGAS